MTDREAGCKVKFQQISSVWRMEETRIRLASSSAQWSKKIADAFIVPFLFACTVVKNMVSGTRLLESNFLSFQAFISAYKNRVNKSTYLIEL